MSLQLLLGDPTDIVDIVIGESGSRVELRVEGDAKGTVVVSGLEEGKRAHFACDAATGAAATMPAEITAPIRREELVVGGVRLYVRNENGTREIVRRLPDGWIEVLHEVRPDTRVVWTDRYAFAVLPGHEHFTNKASLFAVVVGPDGPIINVTMPPWLVTSKTFDTVSLPQARAVVIASGKRVLWLTYDSVEQLRRIAPRMVKLRAAVSGATSEGEVTVTRGGSSGAVVEGADGRRIMINKQHASVKAGDRLTVTTIKGVYALVNAAGTMVAREDKIGMVRTVTEGAAAFRHYDTVISATESAGAKVRDQVGTKVRKRLHRLAALLVPTLNDRAIDDAAIALHRRDDYVPPRAAIAASGILYTHLAKHPLPTDRALVGKDAIVEASRANEALIAARATRRWHLVTMTRYQPFALCLEPAEHDTIVDEDLLFFEPVPAYKPLPDTAEAARAEIAALLELTDSELACTPTTRGRYALRFTTRGAAWLDRRLQDTGE